MYRTPDRFRFESMPRADARAMVIAGNARFTVLASRCIRMEYAPDGCFEDRSSIVFVNRHLPVPVFRINRTGANLTIVTDALKLTFDSSAGGFTPGSLSIAIKKMKTAWKFGDKETGNLGGTCRTLDGVRGPAKLDPGLMSRDGWSVVDDSGSIVFDDDCWVVNRGGGADAKDIYFFGYGRDYQGCLRDFCALSGPVPLVPRWALGNWWSRFWEYTDSELLELMNEFRRRDIPLSVCIIDMDWHLPGWTGYTWSKKHFPEPEKALARLHDLGLKVALNLHPHDGIHPHEEAYERMARFMGTDPAGKKPVPFDIADKKFADGYFRVLHHPYEKTGVDFWWMDWQQGQKCSVEGLDPLFMLNHLHYYDLARDGTKRPFIFSRWHGLGNHRYQIGFSGDTVVYWDSLAPQPHFTATASNVGYTWWSHDIGGHFWGVEDPEHYIRWVQWGVFAPIMRLHSSKNRFQERTPWGNGPEAELVASDAMRLRHRLVPYIYSIAHKTNRDSLPLIRPMYWEHPDDDQAYACPRQYLFGTELMAAPFTGPRDPDTRLSRVVVWLPQGEWYDFFSGERIEGDRWHACYGTIADIPVFAKAGAIIPMSADGSDAVTANPEKMNVRLFAGADGMFELYEDDGESNKFTQGVYCTTILRQKYTKKAIEVSVAGVQGDSRCLPKRRVWNFEIVGVAADVAVIAHAGERPVRCEKSYDAATVTLSVTVHAVSPDTPIVLSLKSSGGGILDCTDRFLIRVHRHMKFFSCHVNNLSEAYERFFVNRQNPAQLSGLAHVFAPSQLRFFCEHLFDAGLDCVADASTEKHLILWNNRKNRAISWNSSCAHGQWKNGSVVPRFMLVPQKKFLWNDKKCVIPDWGPWSYAINYDGIHRVIAHGHGHERAGIR